MTSDTSTSIFNYVFVTQGETTLDVVSDLIEQSPSPDRHNTIKFRNIGAFGESGRTFTAFTSRTCSQRRTSVINVTEDEQSIRR